MDKKEMQVSEMDDHALQTHALVMAYRDAERRCEEAKAQTERLNRESRDLETQLKEMTEAYQALMKRYTALAASARKQQKELESLRNRDSRDLEAQLKEMTEAYQTLMKKNTALTASLRKQQRELESLRNGLKEKKATEDPQERGQNA